MCVFFPFILEVKFVGRTSRGHTGFLTHLPSAVLAFIFLARRIQPFLSLVDREVEFCVLTIQSFSTCGHFFFFFCEEKSQLPGFELTSQRARRFRGYQLSYRDDRHWEDNPAARGQLRIHFPLSPFAPENLVPRVLLCHLTCVRELTCTCYCTVRIPDKAI